MVTGSSRNGSTSFGSSLNASHSAVHGEGKLSRRFIGGAGLGQIALGSF